MVRLTERELEALDEFLNAMSKDERDFFRRVVRKVRRVRVRRVIRKVGRSVRRVARHIKKGINWIGDKLKILEIAKALKKLISKGLNFAGFNFRQDARELAGILRERNQKKLEDKLVKFVAKNLGKKVLEKIPKVGQLLMLLNRKKSWARKVNKVFKTICGALGHNKSIEDHFQRMGKKIISKKTLRFIPYHDRYIRVLGRTLAGQIEHLRSRIITAVLSRYGLCDGGSSRRRSGRRRSGRRLSGRRRSGRRRSGRRRSGRRLSGRRSG